MSQRRFRLDGVADALGRGYSGRRVVMVGVVVLLAVGAVLTVAFVRWRASHRVLAEFGRAEVAPVVEPLTARVPPGADAEQWRRAVADTRAMLEVITGAGLLWRRCGMSCGGVWPRRLRRRR
jgi:hypothetical protein